jgi:hypothetical protein
MFPLARSLSLLAFAACLAPSVFAQGEPDPPTGVTPGAAGQANGVIVGSIETESSDQLEIYHAYVSFSREGSDQGFSADDTTWLDLFKDTFKYYHRSGRIDLPEGGQRRYFAYEVAPGNYRVHDVRRVVTARVPNERVLYKASLKKPQLFEVRPGVVTYVGRFFVSGYPDVCKGRVVGAPSLIEYFYPCLRKVYAENTDKFAEDKKQAPAALKELGDLPWQLTSIDPGLAPHDRPNYAYMLERIAPKHPDVRRQPPSEAEMEAMWKETREQSSRGHR